MNFKEEYNIIDRYRESKNILFKYPDRIPIICERSKKFNNDLPKIDKNKYCFVK